MSEQFIVDVLDLSVRAGLGTEIKYAEPAYALLDNSGTPQLGNPAQASARSQPSRIQNRYFAELTTEPLAVKNSGIRHHADLVWHQLSQIKNLANGNDWVICLPSDFSQEQMALLSGICQSLGLEVEALINRGLAQIAGNSENGHITHMELQLHQLVISQYRVNQSQLELTEHERISGFGYLRLLDRQLHLLRDRFIESSRFDPLHSGATEQQLFDQLIGLSGDRQDREFVIDTPNKSYRVQVPVQELAQITQNFISEIRDIRTSSDTCLWDPAFSQLPGFSTVSGEKLLPANSTFDGAALLSAQRHESDGIVYISSINVTQSIDPAPAAAMVPAAKSAPEPLQPMPAANALVDGGIVFRSSELEALETRESLSGIIFDLNSGSLKIEGIQPQILINNVPAAEDQQLFANDRLSFQQGSELLAVKLND